MSLDDFPKYDLWGEKHLASPCTCPGVYTQCSAGGTIHPPKGETVEGKRFASKEIPKTRG